MWRALRCGAVFFGRRTCCISLAACTKLPPPPPRAGAAGAARAGAGGRRPAAGDGVPCWETCRMARCTGGEPFSGLRGARLPFVLHASQGGTRTDRGAVGRCKSESSGSPTERSAPAFQSTAGELCATGSRQCGGRGGGGSAAGRAVGRGPGTGGTGREEAGQPIGRGQRGERDRSLQAPRGMLHEQQAQARSRWRSPTRCMQHRAEGAQARGNASGGTVLAPWLGLALTGGSTRAETTETQAPAGGGCETPGKRPRAYRRGRGREGVKEVVPWKGEAVERDWRKAWFLVGACSSMEMWADASGGACACVCVRAA